MACPEIDELARLADGLLDAASLASLEAHLDVCAECAAVAAAMAGAETAGDDDGTGAWLAPGDTIGRYEIVEWLGAGGMGTVYVADDPQLGRRIALKLVRGSGGDERLVAEARAMARLSHQNVVAVYDAGRAVGRAFIAMELVHGVSLAEWCQSERSWREIVAVFLAAGRGLAAAHDAGILHRDFKPANVLCGDDGRVLVGDFGLARAAGEPERAAASGTTSPAMALTQSGTVLGTPAYMAPEQFRGREVDPRADQFSFAVALYQALTGQLPFAGSDPEALVTAAEAARLRPPPPSLRLPRGVLAVVQRGLRADPDERFPSMSALLDALAAATRRRRRVVASAAAALVAAGVAVAMLAAGDAPPTLGDLCADSSAELEKVWNDARAAKLEAAFLATDRPGAGASWQLMRRGLDRFGARYQATAARVCVTTHVARSESPELGAQREHCLADHLARVDRLLHRLVDAEQLEIDDAISVVTGLPPTSECEGMAVLGDLHDEPPEAVRAEVEATRDRLDDVRTLIALEREAEALADAEAVVAEATRLGHRSLEAYALLSLAQIQRALPGKLDEARDSAARALTAAQAAGHSRFSAEAALELAQLGAEQKPPAADVDRWLDVARANVEQLGDPPSMLASVARVEGRNHYVRGDYREALVAFQRQAELSREIYGADSAPVADTLGAVATAEMLLGDVDDAIAAFERAHATLRDNLGDAHSDVLRIHNNLGLAYKDAERYPEAEATMTRYLALCESRFGAESGEVGDALVNLAIVLRRQQRIDEAEAALRRAREIFAAVRGPEHFSIGAVALNLSTIYAELGRGDDALASARQGLEIFKKILPADHPTLSQGHAIVGDLAAELGRHDEAVEHLSRALEIRVAKLGEAHPSSQKALRSLGASEVAAGRRGAGIAHLERAVELSSADGDPSGAAVARIYLAQALARSAPGRARRLATEAAALVKDGGAELEPLRAEAAAVLADLDR